MKQKLIYWAAMLLLLAACDKKKEEPEPPKPPIIVHEPPFCDYPDMTLYDKPLEVVKEIIEGKWRAEYKDEGYHVYMTFDNNILTEDIEDDRYQEGYLRLQWNYTWVKDASSFSSYDLIPQLTPESYGIRVDDFIFSNDPVILNAFTSSSFYPIEIQNNKLILGIDYKLDTEQQYFTSLTNKKSLNQND
jgi:hypothetical protein